MNKSLQNPLFSLDVKIGGKQMSVPVYEKDNHDSLVQRFCDQHLVKQDYKQAVKDKIIENLLQILKQGKIQEPTKNKISHFLATEPRISSKKPSARKPQEKSVEKQTPFKQIPSSNRKSSLRKSSPNRHKHGQCSNSFYKNPSIQYKKPCIIKNRLDENKNPSVLNSKKVDSQLVRAYETILKKTRDPHMKQMAKKFLQECAGVKKTDQMEYKKNLMSRKKQNEVVKIVKQNIENEPSVSKVEKCDLSLTKFQLIENSIEQEKGVQQLRKRMRSMGGKNRIKYYIQEEPCKQELVYKEMYNGMDYSLGSYQNKESRSRVRASLSYDRLPYYHPSVGQSKLICEGRYDSFYEQGPSMFRQSPRKNRKFKYL